MAEYVFPNKQDGYFLEVGAANGREVSSCYVLEKEFGWKGICVEPSDYFFEQLVRNRPNSICEQVCLSNQVGTVTFIEGSDETVSPYLSGIKSNLETVKYQGKEVVAKGKEVKKEAVTLEVLLKKYHAPQVIDYAAFDIEGSELDVLEVFPFESYVFLALSLECDGSIRLPISQLLESNGYQRAKNPFNRDKPWEMYWLHQSVY
ncbi:MAG: FkbM family methyltransferase [Aphanizomenon gracile PMC649.10]|nr:FkbM family methyltransferase [Aphanizomenon gracile PMC649.10]